MTLWTISAFVIYNTSHTDTIQHGSGFNKYIVYMHVYATLDDYPLYSALRYGDKMEVP